MGGPFCSRRVGVEPHTPFRCWPNFYIYCIDIPYLKALRFFYRFSTDRLRRGATPVQALKGAFGCRPRPRPSAANSWASATSGEALAGDAAQIPTCHRIIGVIRGGKPVRQGGRRSYRWARGPSRSWPVWPRQRRLLGSQRRLPSISNTGRRSRFRRITRVVPDAHDCLLNSLFSSNQG